MTVTIGRIDDFVAGDDLEIERTITAIPSGVIIDTAWFMVKRKFTDEDDEALISKTITTANLSTIGWIEDTGSDGEGLLHFYLIPDDTVLLTPLSEYQYSVKLKLSDNKLKTPERGVIVAEPAIKTGST